MVTQWCRSDLLLCKLAMKKIREHTVKHYHDDNTEDGYRIK